MAAAKEVVELDERGSEIIRRNRFDWEAFVHDCKESYEDAQITLTNDNSRITITGSDQRDVLVDVRQFIEERQVYEKCVRMARKMAEMLQRVEQKEIQRILEYLNSKKEKAVIEIELSQRGLILRGDEDLCREARPAIDQLHKKLLGADKKLEMKQGIKTEIRQDMITGKCSRETEKVLKEKNCDYEVVRDTEIPRSMGIFLSMYDKDTLAEVQSDIVETAQDDGIKEDTFLTTEKHANSIKSVIVRITFDNEKDKKALGHSEIIQMEDDSRTVIEEKTKPDEGQATQGGFLYDYIALEVKEDDFSVFFSCHDLMEFSSDVDAIISTTRTECTFDDGFAAAVREKGGETIVKECHDYLKKLKKPLEMGMYVPTGAGDLFCKSIFHAVTPIWQGGNHNEKEQLKRVITDVLGDADERMYSSIGLPALGSGGFGWNIDESLGVILQAIKDYFTNRKNKTGILRDIHIVDLNTSVERQDKIYTLMLSVFKDKKKIYTKEDKIKKNKNTISYQILASDETSIEQAKMEIEQRHKNGMAEFSNALPTRKLQHATQLYTMDSTSTNSSDYKEIKSMFTNWQKSAKIIDIEQIGNVSVHENMMKHQKEICKHANTKKCGCVKMLWHGTRESAARGIATEGFKLKYSGDRAGCVMGKGIYFSPKLEKSDIYAADPSGYRFMLRCSVLTGKSTDNKSARTVDFLQSVKCHSKVDSVKDPKEYCVFWDTQARPDYLIKYQL